MERCFKSLCRFVLATDSFECDPETLRFSSFIRCQSNTDQNKTVIASESVVQCGATF